MEEVVNVMRMTMDAANGFQLVRKHMYQKTSSSIVVVTITSDSVYIHTTYSYAA